jgi:hypothetical protein
LIFVALSCKQKKNETPIYDDSILQICIRPQGVLKAYIMGDEGGMETIQLFDNSFNLITEAPLYSSYPFKISNWEKDTIQITFVIGGDDETRFLVWLKGNVNIPRSIGKFKISYNYYITPGGTSAKKLSVDSLQIDKERVLVRFWTGGRIVKQCKIDSLRITYNKFMCRDNSVITFINFKSGQQKSIKSFLNNLDETYKK